MRFAVPLIAAAVIGGVAQPLTPQAHAAPDPRVEYVYDVAVRRQYNFPNNDALGYGYGSTCYALRRFTSCAIQRNIISRRPAPRPGREFGNSQVLQLKGCSHASVPFTSPGSGSDVG